MSSSSRRPNITINSHKLLEDLANLSDNGGAYFRRRWKRFSFGVRDKRASWRENDEELLQYRDELRLLWPGPAERLGGQDVRVIAPTRRTANLVHSEEHSPVIRPMEEAILDVWFRRMPTNQFVFKWSPRFKGVRPDFSNLGVMLALACVKHADNLRYCWNPECRQPYFIAQKRDQKYCGDECAVHGKREAKREWWRRNRAKS